MPRRDSRLPSQTILQPLDIGAVARSVWTLLGLKKSPP